jgi:DNA-directed RNA polymerase specialized sigma24 family protein
LARLPTSIDQALAGAAHGYSNREMATSLGVPESTVATRLVAAKRTLRARLSISFQEDSDTSGSVDVSVSE